MRIRAYPTHESGGVVWTYMGPADTVPAFRDLGTESVPAEHIFASKLYSPCNWVQGPRRQYRYGPHLLPAQYHATLDIPDDGTDAPGYVSNSLAWKMWKLDGAPRIETEDTWYGYRYAGIRTTPNGHTYVRITDFIMPYITYIAATPVGGDIAIAMVPADDTSFWRYNFATRVSQRRASRAANPAAFNQTPFLRGDMRQGIIPRTHTAENDYQIDRESQRNETYAGILDFVSQDMAVTESMGDIFDRTGEHLGTTDKAIIRMRRMLIQAARDLEDGIEPIATGPSESSRSVHSAEKILAPGEDWRYPRHRRRPHRAGDGGGGRRLRLSLSQHDLSWWTKRAASTNVEAALQPRLTPSLYSGPPGRKEPRIDSASARTSDASIGFASLS